MSGRAVWLWLSALVAAALAVRCTGFAEVFQPDAVVLPGHDPYYHMRRVLLILESYPRVPLFDAWINHPFGAVVIWTPLFDLFAATVMRIVGVGAQDTRSAEIVAAWIVPLLGALTTIPLYRLGQRLGGAAVGLVAALLLALSPGHVWYSRLGFFDHHVAVTLIQVVLLLVFASACLPREDGRPRTLATLATVACMVAGLLTWSGFLFFVAVLDLYLLLRLVCFREDRHGPRLIWMVHLPAAVLLLPTAAGFVARTGEPFTAITLSYFHVSALAWFGLLGAVADVYRSSRSRRLAWPLRLALPAALATAAMIFLAGTSALREGLEWLLARDVFMAQVNESQPLLSLSRQKGGWHAELHGLATVLFPVSVMAWIWLAARRWKPWGAADAPRQLFLVWSAALLLAATGQRRFMEAFAPAEGLLVALGLVAVVRAVWRSTRAGAVLGLLMLLAGAFVPWHSGGFRDRDRFEVKRGDEWLYRAIDSFEPQAGESTASGALGPWYLGHRILYQTGLPVVSNNFGSHIGADSYRDWSAFFLADSEAEAVSLLERRNVRYVFVDHDLDFVQSALHALGLSVDDYLLVDRDGVDTEFTPLEPYLKTMAFRMVHLLGNERSFLDTRGALFTVPALERFRLVHEVVGDGGALRVYELVAGARLEIVGTAGQRVRVEHGDHGKGLGLDDAGRGRTIVPWAGVYRVRVGEAVHELEVPEDAVRRGLTLRVPPSP